MPIRQNTSLVQGLRLYAREFLPPSSDAVAATVVLVPGLSVSGRYMLPLARVLARSHRVLVLDMPGAGRSQHPPRALSPHEQAGLISAWCSRLGIGPALFIGNSLACHALLHLAARAPAQARGLVLIGLSLDPAARRPWRQLGRFLLAAIFEPPRLWAIAVRDYLHSGIRFTWRTLGRAIADPIEHVFPHVHCPVLLLRGTRDALSPPTWNDAAARSLPHAHHVALGGEVHAINYDAPSSVAAWVDSFLERCVFRWSTRHAATFSGASMIEKCPTPGR